jgi:hypothetical protein
MPIRPSHGDINIGTILNQKDECHPQVPKAALILNNETIIAVNEKPQKPGIVMSGGILPA